MIKENPEHLKARRKEKRHELARTEILDAVIDLVTENGSNDIRLLHIAKKLGLTKPALYHYYESKEVLVFDVIPRELTRTANIIDETTSHAKNGIEAVDLMMRLNLEKYLENHYQGNS